MPLSVNNKKKRRAGKLLALFMTVVFMATSISGCGKKKSDKNNETVQDQKTTETTDQTTEEDTEDTTEKTTSGGNSLIPETTIPEVKIDAYEIPVNEGTLFVRDMKIGVNLGNTFDAYVDGPGLKDEMDTETAWISTKINEQAIKDYHAAGFQSVRIPVSWHNHLVDDDFTISEKWLAHVKEVVDWAINEDMYVIINIHHDNHLEAGGFYPDEAHMEQSERYIRRIWEQLSECFKDYDEKLIFESMNEPRLVGNTYEWWFPAGGNDEIDEAVECINKLNQVFVDTVRASGGNNKTRFLMCPGYDASADGALYKGFRLPEDPEGPADHIIVSVHAYTPYDFALNLSGTSSFSVEQKRGTSDIDSFMDKLYQKYIKNGVPVVIGEFGALDKKQNLQARVDFAAYYIASARARGMTALWWDNSSFSGNGENFGLYYRTGGYFLYEGLINALMEYVD